MTSAPDASAARPGDPAASAFDPARDWLVPHWPIGVTGVRAAMTTRTGGVSAAPRAAADGRPGLNLGTGCGDRLDRVHENRARVAAALGCPVLWLDQVHGADIVDADADACADSGPGRGPDANACSGAGPEAGTRPPVAAPSLAPSLRPTPSFATPSAPAPTVATPSLATASVPPPPRADAAFTTRADLALAVIVADCLPVLVASRDGRIVGAAHAGWRGLAAGVLPALVTAMRARCPDARFVAWLGPRIGPAVFEVGPEVRAAFVARIADAATAFRPSGRPGHWLCDLGALARRDLAAAGVVAVADPGLCTTRDGDRFWSHRRDRPGGRTSALIRRTA